MLFALIVAAVILVISFALIIWLFVPERQVKKRRRNYLFLLPPEIGRDYMVSDAIRVSRIPYLRILFFGDYEASGRFRFSSPVNIIIPIGTETLYFADLPAVRPGEYLLLVYFSEMYAPTGGGEASPPRFRHLALSQYFLSHKF